MSPLNLQPMFPVNAFDSPDSHSRINPAWRKPYLIALNLGAFLLLGSWLFPASRAVWDKVDRACFELLNGSLASGGLWTDLWAVASIRPFDLVGGAAILFSLCRKDWLFRQFELRKAFFTFLGLLIVSLIIRVTFTKIVTYMGWQHSSPTLQLEGAIRLREQYPFLEEHFELKDSASKSFPGDHASVLLLWTLFVGQFARKGKLLIILGITTFLVLPRLIAGAHWLSDVLVGGLFVATLGFAWGYFTPLAAKLATGFSRLGSPLMNRLGRLPGLKCFSILCPDMKPQQQKPN